MLDDPHGPTPRHETAPETAAPVMWNDFRSARDRYFARVHALGEIDRLERAWGLPDDPPQEPEAQR